MFSLFNAPRRYPRIYEPWREQLDFYNGREHWLEQTAPVPREAVLLFCVHWLHLEVFNGGFWQYFHNSTGTTCPEAIEGFGAIGIPEVASIVERAASKLGEPYPFDTVERGKVVGAPDERMDFEVLDTEFYERADTAQFFRKVPKFVPFAEAFADAFEIRAAS